MPTGSPSIPRPGSADRGRRGRLRARLVAWLYVPTVLVLGAVASFTFYTYQRMTADLVLGRDLELTTLHARQLDTELISYVNILDTLARNPDIWRFEPALQQVTLRRAVAQLRSFDAGVMTVDLEGRVLAADPRRLEAVGQNWSAREYVRRTLGPVTGPAVFSDIAPDGPDGADAVAIALPVRDNRGKIPGIIIGMFRVGYVERSDLYRSIASSPPRPGIMMYLVDRRGRVIYHRDATLIGQDLSSWLPVQSVVRGESGALRTRDQEGVEIVASYAPLPDNGWGVVTEESWGALTRPILGYQRLLIALLALGLLGPTLIVTVGVGRVTQPVARLLAAAKEIAEGRLGQRIAVRTGDELEELAEQFNAMSEQLGESYATLEQRVADRTRELATINAITAVVSRSLDLRTILSDALEEVVRAAKMDVGAAYRLDEVKQTLELMAERNLGSDAPLELSPAEAGIGTSVRDHPTVVAGNAWENGSLGRQFRRERISQAIAVPLVSKADLLGLLLLGTRQQAPMPPETLSLLRGIGQQAGIAMENARLYERAEQNAAAAERSRLARDLHDAVTQTLFSINLIAGVLPMLWERNPVDGRRRLEELRMLTRGALAEMRTLLLELRPTALTETPLAQLLRQLGEAIAGRQRLPIVFDLTGDAVLPPLVQVALYRIAQEALNNVSKYAQASEVTLGLDVAMREGHATRATLVIADNGVGFDPVIVPADHLGLRIMRERAEAIGADLVIHTALGRGTSVHTTWTAED